ncbi:23S rRNA (uracil(1939)-C(5))-methyltransferase RlmD [Erysipelotrichaceae bacterium OttesenSCG-928-M19]|nr:23S rRNA (uracil(1939)-C(5))-methyltransferase RlmD [Erysipelotrichaceae bacterium OttesenSCG-928-M19]
MKNIEIAIKKIGINGEGIGYYNNTVVFIQNTFPGDLVEINNLEKRDGYYLAKVSKYLKKSNDRQKPQCHIYDKCQVCSLMPLKYESQLQAKVEYLTDSISKYAHKKIKVNKVIADDNPFYYRNSIKLPFFNFNDKLAIGIHFRDTNHYVKLNDCIVQSKIINQITRDVLNILDKYRYRAYDKQTKQGLRYFLVRAFDDEAMVTFVTGKNTKIVDEALDEMMEITNLKSINQTTNTKANNKMIVEPIKNLRGKKSINVPFNNFTFKLSPESFIQLNSKQAIKMYDVIKEYLGNNNQLVLDLFCGIGSITCYINECAQRIIGIEINKAAIKDAKENAKKHRLNNLEFVCGDVDEKIKTYAKNRDVDAIIVDPPRTGLSDFTIESIIRSKAKKLIYASCNPSTLGKDLKTLLKYYEIKDVTLIDMFPNTMHVECVVLMSRVQN